MYSNATFGNVKGECDYETILFVWKFRKELYENLWNLWSVNKNKFLINIPYIIYK